MHTDYSSFKNIMLHEACGKDELRPDMSFVYFTNEAAIATNGHIYIEVPYANLGYSTELIATLQGHRMSPRQFVLVAANSFVYLDPTTPGVIALDGDGHVKVILEKHDTSVVKVWQDKITRIEQGFSNPSPIQSVKVSGIMLSILCKVFYQAWSGFVFKFDNNSRHIKVEMTDYPQCKVFIYTMG